MEQLKQKEFDVYPDEMTYHKDRFLHPSRKCELVRFVGAFHSDHVLTTEVEVICRGNEPGKVARFLVRYGDQEADLIMDLETCRYSASVNIKTKLVDVILVFRAEYREAPKEVV